VGTLGSLGCFSFYPTKNLGAFGDGGAVIGRDVALLERVRLQREYGWTPAARYVSTVPGRNSRLDELQAAILRVRLRHLEAENERRRALAAVYAAALGEGIGLPVERPGCRHVYHLYVVRVGCRDALRARLAQAGIGTAIHYPVPIHLQPAYVDGGLVAHDLAATERAAQEILSLPMYPHLGDAEARAVADAVNAACAHMPPVP
jgi:dTDP-4-amino-4,6-dideoxygalactose transaminase